MAKRARTRPLVGSTPGKRVSSLRQATACAEPHTRVHVGGSDTAGLDDDNPEAGEQRPTRMQLAVATAHAHYNRARLTAADGRSRHACRPARAALRVACWKAQWLMTVAGGRLD